MEEVLVGAKPNVEIAYCKLSIVCQDRLQFPNTIYVQKFKCPFLRNKTPSFIKKSKMAN
jgi:hypothetical protein